MSDRRIKSLMANVKDKISKSRRVSDKEMAMWAAADGGYRNNITIVGKSSPSIGPIVGAQRGDRFRGR